MRAKHYSRNIQFVKKDIKDKKTNGGVNGGVKILEQIKQNELINAHTISKNLNIPQRTAERYLKELKEQNKIEFKGSFKTGGYCIKVSTQLTTGGLGEGK